LTGGTLTGPLVTGTNNVTANGFVLNTGGGNFFANSTVAYVVWDNANYRIQYTRSTGAIQYLRGTDSAQLWLVDASGNETVTGQISCGGHVVAAGNGYHRGGTSYIGSSDRSYFSTDSATSTTVMFHNSGYQLAWAWSDAVWRFYNSSSAVCFAISPVGNCSAAGSISATGALNGGSIASTTVITASAGAMNFGDSGSSRIMQMSSNWYWQWLMSTGQLHWIALGTQMWTIRQGDLFCYNNAGPVGGVGAYSNISDERMKSSIAQAEYGLPEILKIQPIVFKRIPRAEHMDNMPEEVGFSAQQLKPILPHAVTERVIDDQDMMMIDSDVIIAALVNAVKTLEQRISAMENK
jgi:hypothetical protein